MDPGFGISFINPGNSFDVTENSCYSKLESQLSEDILIKTMYFSKTGKSICNWCCLADEARGYCFCYRFKGIMRAIKEKLSTIKGKYICVYGYVNYGNRSSKDASDPWKDYVNSVFSKGVFYMMMEGFDLLILGKGRYRRPGFKPKQLVNNGIYMRTGFVQCESKAVGKEVKTQ